MVDKSPTGLKGNSKKYNIRVKYKGNTIKTWIFLSKFLFYTQKKIFKAPYYQILATPLFISIS